MENLIELRKTRTLLSSKERQIKEHLFKWDEVQLRELGEKYYVEIARAKNTKECTTFLTELQFLSLNENFKLIKDYEEDTLFILRDEIAHDILKKIKLQYKKKKKVKHIPRKFYEYILNIAQKDRQSISGKIEPYPDKDEAVFWILRDNELYDSNWGLNIEK